MKSLGWMTAVAALLLATAAGGCRLGETARSVDFKPGVYQGEKIPPLTAEQERQLVERTKLMR